MSSAAACHLVSHQQTRQFSNKLNFISAQLIITFPQECFGLDDMALRKNSHMAATVWYPMNALMCYQFCMWLLSMWLLLKNTRWTFWGNIHASLTECKTCSSGGGGGNGFCQSSAHLLLECLSSFNFHASLQYRRHPAQMQCHTCSCGNENSLFTDVYNVSTPH